VQGVGFRNYVRKHALRLGVSGFAKNLADGGVEVYAVANATSSLDQLSGYVRRGPMLAEVRTVDEQVAEVVNDWNLTDGTGFAWECVDGDGLRG
jgi:acylphosphatase